MAAGDKFCLVRLVTSDFLELGVRLAPLNSELFDLGHFGHLGHPFISSDFVHQLVASLPPQEVRRNWLNYFLQDYQKLFTASKIQSGCLYQRASNSDYSGGDVEGGGGG